MLAHKVAIEPGGFWYKVLNPLHPTNTKLYNILLSTCYKCTFFQIRFRNIPSSFVYFSTFETFWNEFDLCLFSSTEERICLTKNIQLLVS